MVLQLGQLGGDVLCLAVKIGAGLPGLFDLLLDAFNC